MKLKYVLFQLGSSVIFQVTHMDERFRGQHFVARNGFGVASRSMPDIEEDTVYLWGSAGDVEDDAAVGRAIFSTEGSAASAIAKARAALEDWATNWEGFQPLEQPDTSAVLFQIRETIL